MIDHFYESIPGWFNFQDIYKEQVERARDGARFVEVGSWLGRSAAFMATEIANSGKRIAFYCVDTWKGSPGAQYQSVLAELASESAYEAFKAHLERGGVWDRVIPMIHHSIDAARMFPDESLDFVFLDAAHDFHSVRDDVRAWLPKVKVGGVIAGHDANCPGLMNAVKVHVPAAEIEYRGTSWLHEVTPIVQSPPLWSVGVLDYELGEWAAVDYARRCHLAGWRNQGPFNLPPGDPAPYVKKWGGPPGEETFDFPYGITTTDW